METSTIRVLVVDDFEPFRRWVRSKLEGHEQFRIVGEANDGLEAVQKAYELQPDLIVLDIGLPLLYGIEAARRICQSVPQAKILFLSSNNHNDLVKEAMSTGAKGYLLKAYADSELLPAIKAVLRGKEFVSMRLNL